MESANREWRTMQTHQKDIENLERNLESISLEKERIFNDIYQRNMMTQFENEGERQEKERSE